MRSVINLTVQSSEDGSSENRTAGGDAATPPSHFVLLTSRDAEADDLATVSVVETCHGGTKRMHPHRTKLSPFDAVLHLGLTTFAESAKNSAYAPNDALVTVTFTAPGGDGATNRSKPLSLSKDVQAALDAAAAGVETECHSPLAPASSDRHHIESVLLLQFQREGEYTFDLLDGRLVVVQAVAGASEEGALRRLVLKVVMAVALLAGFVVAMVFTMQFVVGTMLDNLVQQQLSGNVAYAGASMVVSIAKERALGWIIASFAVLFIVCVALLVHCCSRRMTFGAVYASLPQYASQSGAIGSATTCAAIVISLWAVVLGTDVGLQTTFRVVALGVTNALNQAMGIVTALQYLVNQLPAVVPTIGTVPASAIDALSQAKSIASSVQIVAANGDSVVEAVLQAVSVLQFCSLQVVIFSAALMLVSSKTRSSRPMCSAAFFIAFSLCLVLFAIGLTALANGIFEKSYSLSVAFNNNNLTASQIQTNLQLSSDSPLMQVFSFCAANGTLSPAYIKTVMNTLIGDYNAQAVNTSLPTLDRVEGSSLADLILSSTWATQQLDTISARVAAEPALFAKLLPTLNGETVPFLHAAIATLRGVNDLVNCQIVRNVIGETLPVMKTQLIDRYAIQLDLYYALVALLAVSIVVAVVASHIFHYPTHEASEGYRNNQALPALMSVPSALAGTYTFHNTNAISLSSQAVMLVIAHVSAEANRLSVYLQVVAFVCVVVPLIVLLDMLCTSHAALRVMLRVLMMLICVVGVVLCIISANDDGTTFSSCVGSLTFAAGNTTSGNISYPYDSTCTADKVLKQAQSVVYSCVVGLTCLFGFATSLVLVFVPRYNPFANLARRKTSTEPEIATAEEASTTDRFTAIELALAFAGVLASVVVAVVVATAFYDSSFTKSSDSTTSTSTSSSTLSYSFVVSPSVDPDTCNGYRGICDVPIHRVIWPGTHNSFSTQEDGFVTPNHFYTYSRQLKAGFRAFMIDVWQKDTDPYQPYHCHEICALGNFPMLRLLTETKAFLDANPREVVILMLEQYFHTPNMTVAFERANLTQLLWAPANQSDSPQNNPWFVWPTLRQLIAQNKRLLLSTDTRQGTVVNPDPVPVWLTYSWDYQFEDPYSHESVDDLDCRYNRGYTTDNATMRNKMPTFNHYLTAPLATPGLASAANAPEVLRAHVERCKAAWGVLPSLIAVDYWDVQEPLRTLSALQTQYVAKS